MWGAYHAIVTRWTSCRRNVHSEFLSLMIACVNIGNDGIVEPSINNIIISLFQFVTRCDDPAVVDRLSPARRRDDATDVWCHPSDRYTHIYWFIIRIQLTKSSIGRFSGMFFIAEVFLLYLVIAYVLVFRNGFLLPKFSCSIYFSGMYFYYRSSLVLFFRDVFLLPKFSCSIFQGCILPASCWCVPCRLSAQSLSSISITEPPRLIRCQFG